MNAFRVAITTGDPDGIGTEVATKAIADLELDRPVHFYFFRSSQCPKAHLKHVDKKVYRKQVTSIDEALLESHIEDTVFFDIVQDTNPIFHVKEASELCQEGKIDALVTGPLSKPLIEQSGMNVVGHTGLFRQMNQSKPLFMAFMGSEFNVALVTDHVPLRDVSNTLTPELVVSCILEANKLREDLPGDLKNRPLGLLGLNPHASDQGLIGQEEGQFLQQIVHQCNSNGIPIEGPLVPDVAFQRENWNKYSIFICHYHDQGLIPFKLVHGQNSGVHITLGLPFVRTSVDHGTAKDIFNQDKAKSESMLEAILWALNYKTREV